MYDDYFELTDRAALIITPKRPFLDWLISHGEENKDVDLERDPDVYLIPEYEEEEELEAWLSITFDLFFRDMMNKWYTDERMWVQKRTFKMFREWFDYKFHTMVWDTLPDPIEKD